MITPVASLHQATSGDLARSLMWRDLLCRYQVGDIATSVYRDRFGCWAFLDLWRMQNAPPFAAAELEFLHGIAGPLTAALRHAQAAAFTAAPAGEQPSAGPVVLLLSPALEVRAQTPQTQQYLRLLVPPDTAAQAPVPAGAYNVGAQLLAREAGVDGNPGHRAADVRVREHGPGSPQVHLHQDRQPNSEGPARPRPADLAADRGFSSPSAWLADRTVRSACRAQRIGSRDDRCVH
jgi:hypothetical protein